MKKQTVFGHSPGQLAHLIEICRSTIPKAVNTMKNPRLVTSTNTGFSSENRRTHGTHVQNRCPPLFTLIPFTTLFTLRGTQRARTSFRLERRVTHPPGGLPIARGVCEGDGRARALGLGPRSRALGVREASGGTGGVLRSQGDGW